MDKIKCIVCGNEQKNGAMCHSVFKPILSFYCSTCLKQELEPYEYMIEWAQNLDDFPSNCPIEFIEVLNKNLKYYKKTLIEFIEDLDKTN